VTISIDGHGGDEILGGYPSTVRRQRQRDLAHLDLTGWTQHARISLGMGDTDQHGRAVPDLRTMLHHDLRRGVSGGALLHRSAERFASSSAGRMLRRLRSREISVRAARVDELLTELTERERALSAESVELTALGQDLYRAFHHDLLPVILRNFDRLSMASGVEIRAPLLDWRVVTFATALPDEAKLGGGFAKRLLRDAAGDLLPAAVRDRTDKVGFKAPVAQWLEQGLAEVALEVVQRRTWMRSCRKPPPSDRLWWPHTRGRTGRPSVACGPGSNERCWSPGFATAGASPSDRQLHAHDERSQRNHPALPQPRCDRETDHDEQSPADEL
jgi:asparagine synthetase B (glutamine-hydrolysing)